MRKAGHLEQCSKLILQKIWYHWSSSLMVGILQYILIDDWFISNVLNKKKAFQVLNPTESSDVIQGSI